MITLTLSSKIDIFKESTRYPSKVMNRNPKKDLLEDNKTRLIRSNKNSWCR